MSNSIYGGDEVGAVVFDFGSFTSRCGYAGEELPKADIPSYVGWSLLDPMESMETEVEQNEDHYVPTTPRTRRHFCGDNHLSHIYSNSELKELHKDDSLYDFDVFEELLHYMYECKLYTNPENHPALFTEPYNNPKINREKLTELMFEKFDCVALSVCKSPVLSSFANGRTTSLIVDMGHNKTSICPVSDGYCLTQACVKTSITGAVLSHKTEELLTKDFGIDLTPRVYIKKKQLRNIGETPLFELKDNLCTMDQKWLGYHRMKLIQDFQHNTFMVSDSNLINAINRSFPINVTEYQFPTGYRLDLTKKFHDGHYAYKIPELYFNEDLQKSQNITSIKSLQSAIDNVVNTCDVDMRSCLLSNIILCGGCSSISGMSDRLYNELSSIISPTLKIKVLTPNSTADKKFSAWIGGSILASLGSFQQLWVSPTEYKEIGVNCTSIRSIT